MLDRRRVVGARKRGDQEEERDGRDVREIGSG